MLITKLLLFDVIINKKSYSIREDKTYSIMQACEQVGITIPRFCYHEKLLIAGNCRMCLVEMEKSPKPVVACAMPISKGAVIYTETPLVKKARESVLELLLKNHPLDCPICDQGGECDLQEYTMKHASHYGRMYYSKRTVQDKHFGPIIKTIMTRCIHCTRCVRFATMYTGVENLGAFGRGENMEIGTYINKFLKNELSGNLVDLCPVGALTAKPYAYTARVWELQNYDSFDFFDGLASEISIQTRFNTSNNKMETNDEIMRILPRNTNKNFENWISDKTRFAYTGLQKRLSEKTQERFYNNFIQSITSSNLLINLVDYFLAEWQNHFNNNNRNETLCIVEEQIDIETLYLLNSFIKILGGTTLQDSTWHNNINNDLSAFWSLNNTIDDIINIKSLLIIGSNPRFEASLLNSNLKKKQIMNDLFYTIYQTQIKNSNNMTHGGISFLSLLITLENKKETITKCLKSIDTSLIFGTDILKNTYGNNLQNLYRFLSKKFLTKRKSKETASFLNKNLTSLAFLNLGVGLSVRSKFYNKYEDNKTVKTLILIQPYKILEQKFISNALRQYTTVFSFNIFENTKNFDYNIPLKSLYERKGFIANAENRLKLFNKVITPNKTSYAVGEVLAVLLSFFWNKEEVLIDHTIMLNNETNLLNLKEKVLTNYNLLYFLIKECGFLLGMCLLYTSVHNFYKTDSISENSDIMNSANIFMNQTLTKDLQEVY